MYQICIDIMIVYIGKMYYICIDIIIVYINLMSQTYKIGIMFVYLK